MNHLSQTNKGYCLWIQYLILSFMLGNLKWFLNHISFWKKIVIKVNIRVVGRRNQKCNLSSSKQFIFLHWVPPTNLSHKYLVSNGGCMRKDPTMFQRTDSSKNVSMTLILFPFDMPLWRLNICSYHASLRWEVQPFLFSVFKLV